MDDAVGRRLQDLAPSVAAAMADDTKRLLEGGSAVRMVVPVECTRGTAFYQHHFVPVPGAEGTIRGIDVFVCNVDAPARIQEQRRPNTLRARKSAKQAPGQAASLAVSAVSASSLASSAPHGVCLVSGTKTPVA